MNWILVISISVISISILAVAFYLSRKHDDNGSETKSKNKSVVRFSNIDEVVNYEEDEPPNIMVPNVPNNPNYISVPNNPNNPNIPNEISHDLDTITESSNEDEWVQVPVVEV